MAQNIEYKVTWNDIYSRVSKLKKKVKYYGVPRGGQVIAGLTGNAVDEPEYADVIIDDIIDSGKTQKAWRMKYPKKSFIGLYNKLDKDKKLGWVVFPWEDKKEDDAKNIVTRWMQYIGENVNREGLIGTPERVVRSWKKLYGGYEQNPADILKTNFEKEVYNQIIILKNIEFYSTCEHHMLPFYGKISIGYIPDKKVVGVSKLARIVEVFARRMQIQERLTTQISDIITKELQPRGVMVIVNATHFCMTSRGVEKQNSEMVTSSITGAFEKNVVREEFLNLLR